MHLKVVTTVMTSSTGVTRHPTIPLTKRDSLAMTGSRVSLISNTSTNNSHGGTPYKENNNKANSRNANHAGNKFDKQSDFVNSHPEMVAGQKRSPKKVKRTDSYKQAVKRQSGFNDLDQGLAGDKQHVKPKRESESRVKYNTLPIKMEAVEDTPPLNEGKRKKHTSGSHGPSDSFQRNASQKSGTFPSPDTDEDQHSIQPERKKKSAFKRVKERLIQTFRKDRNKETKHRSRKSQKPRHRTVSGGGRIRPSTAGGSKGFHTPNSLEENGGIGQDVIMEVDEDSPSKGKTFIQSIRNSFRKKQRPEKYSRESPKPSTPSKRSSPIDIPNSVHTDEQLSLAGNPDDRSEADDTISEIFGSFIDPTSVHFSAPNCTGPDRSKLKLEGLEKFRPRSFERKDTTGVEIARRGGAHARRGHRASREFNRQCDLSPTVEIDGFDYADAPVRPSAQFQEESDEHSQSYDLVSQEEQQRRVDDVGRRLAAIGDKIVIDKESESATSSSEGGPRRLSAFEEELLRELQNYADDKNKEISNKGGGVNVYLVPIVKKMLTAHSYADFKHIVQREISNTMGWDQVAWYTYLVRTTMCVLETGKDLGTMFRHNATRYFNSNIRPFIRSRPNGWESIVEETDVEYSDVD